MKLKAWIYVAVCVAPSIAIAQETQTSQTAANELEAFCQHASCQRNVVVKLRNTDGTAFEKVLPLMPPAIQIGMLTVLPGQSIEAAASFKDGKFNGWHSVSEAEPNDVLLTFELTQQDKAPYLMLLAVSNKGTKDIKLRLGQVRLGNDTPMRTSSCPVLAGKGDFESWPYPIFEILVGNAKMVDASKSIQCD